MHAAVRWFGQAMGQSLLQMELTVKSMRAAVIPASSMATSVSTSRHEGPSVPMTASNFTLQLNE